jgi:DNA repair exonuclease SbcCD nuclease subunit
MVKFIHVADLHLDRLFTSIKQNRELVKQRRREGLQVFKDVIELTKTEKAPFLFISGDFFEQEYVTQDTIEYIISCFKTIPDVQIFISPGNHDPLIKNSPYNTYTWPENVTIFTSEIGKYSYDGVDIYGIGFEDYEMESDEIPKLKIDDENKINILVTHGFLDAASHIYHDIKTRDLSKFDYVALGHVHTAKIDGTRIIYPGSLISAGFDELGEHGAVIGEVDKNNCTTKFKCMDYSKFDIVELDITNCKSVNEAADMLNLGNDIYRIILTGTRNIDINELSETILSKGSNICDIIDETKLEYNLEEIATQNTLKGKFTKKILEKIQGEPEKKEELMMALEYVFKNM